MLDTLKVSRGLKSEEQLARLVGLLAQSDKQAVLDAGGAQALRTASPGVRTAHWAHSQLVQHGGNGDAKSQNDPEFDGDVSTVTALIERMPEEPEDMVARLGTILHQDLSAGEMIREQGQVLGGTNIMQAEYPA